MSQNETVVKWFVLGDTGRSLADTLTNSTGGVIDLTLDTVKLLLRSTVAGSSLIINTTATIDGTTSGTVSYRFTDTDVTNITALPSANDETRCYYGWKRITTASTGLTEHFPGDDYRKRVIVFTTKIEST